MMTNTMAGTLKFVDTALMRSTMLNTLIAECDAALAKYKSDPTPENEQALAAINQTIREFTVDTNVLMETSRPTATQRRNEYGMTYVEWFNAANAFRSGVLDARVAYQAWSAGEDPATYAVMP